MQALNFPQLFNRYTELPLESMDTDKTDDYRYSLNDLRRPYAEVAASSPSPTRKKVRNNFSEPEMPSAEWLDKHIHKPSHIPSQIPELQAMKGLWPKVFKNTSPPKQATQSKPTQSKPSQSKPTITKPPTNLSKPTSPTDPNLSNTNTPPITKPPPPKTTQLNSSQSSTKESVPVTDSVQP